MHISYDIADKIAVTNAKSAFPWLFVLRRPESYLVRLITVLWLVGRIYFCLFPDVYADTRHTSAGTGSDMFVNLCKHAIICA